jgi:hypothetical protein
VWDLSQKKDILWLKWVQEYYLKGEDFFSYSLQGHRHSWSWGVIVKIKDMILPYLTQCIDSRGKFCTAIAYRWLKGANQKDSRAPLIWKMGLQPKQAFFLWMLLKSRLSTIGRLQSLGMLKKQADCCIFCGKKGETAEHLFLKCSFSKQLQGCLQLKMEENFRGCLKQLYKMARWKGRRKYHRVISLLYHVWQERNRRIFQKKCMTPENLLCNILAGYEEN